LGGAASLSGLFTDLVDESSYGWVINVLGVNDCVARVYAAWPMSAGPQCLRIQVIVLANQG